MPNTKAMKEICPTCLYIGESIQNGISTYKFPLAGFLLGASVNGLTDLVPEGEAFDYVNLVLFIGNIILLVISTYLLYRCLSKSKRACPKCSHGEMISMSTSDADKLVERYNFKF